MTKSEQLFQRAQLTIPGGVNSPVRAFRSVGGTPRFIERAEGAYLYDADGRKYIDYVGSWGPMITGHAHPEVIAAVQQAVGGGLSFGAPTESEVEMAEKICELIPSMEMVRMTSSGTEATMSAIRLARGFTGRKRLIKFEGGYHGHSDSLLVKAGSGALTLGEPNSPGVPEELAQFTFTLDYNDSAQIEQVFAEYGHEIACIIVEPVSGNMNCVPPVDGFLQTLRKVCDESGAVLIFDEVMTGFRVALGGAQSLYNVKPDLTTLGKVIGGGMPVGAFGGRRDIMAYLSPLGPVYQAGTLSGNPIAMAAGLSTLNIISQVGFYEQLAGKTGYLVQSLQQLADKAAIPFSTHQVGGMFGLFFSRESNINTFKQVMNCDTERFKQFFHAMLDKGIYLAPSAYEAGFVSSAHSDADLSVTLAAAESAFSELS